MTDWFEGVEIARKTNPPNISLLKKRRKTSTSVTEGQVFVWRLRCFRDRLALRRREQWLGKVGGGLLMEWHLQSDAFGNVLTRGRRLSGPPVKCLYCFAHRCKETPSKLILLPSVRVWGGGGDGGQWGEQTGMRRNTRKGRLNIDSENGFLPCFLFYLIWSRWKLENITAQEGSRLFVLWRLQLPLPWRKLNSHWPWGISVDEGKKKTDPASLIAALDAKHERVRKQTFSCVIHWADGTELQRIEAE